MICEEKVKYKSKKEANKVKKLYYFKKKLSVYLCPKCFSYHLAGEK